MKWQFIPKRFLNMKSHFFGASIFLFSTAVVAGACTATGVEPSVLGVYGEGDHGYIRIETNIATGDIDSTSAMQADNDDSTCNSTIDGGGVGVINVASDKYMDPEDGNCGVTSSDSTVGQLTLPTFQTYTEVAGKNYAKIDMDSDRVRVVHNFWVEDDGTEDDDGTYTSYKTNTTDTSTTAYEFCKNSDCLSDFEYGYVDDFANGVKSVIVTNTSWEYLRNVSTSHAVYFKYDPTADPYTFGYFRFEESPLVIMEPGSYYAYNVELEEVNLLVRTHDDNGNPLGDGSGKVKFYIYNTKINDAKTVDDANKLFDGESCINIDVIEDLGAFDSDDLTANLTCVAGTTPPSFDTSSVKSDRLGFYIYNGNLDLHQDGFSVAASIYVADGGFVFKGNEYRTIIGEIIAEDILIDDRSGVSLIYQDTGAFSDLYTGGSSSRSGEYSLANSAVASETTTGSYAYVPSQTDSTDTSGITGHLKAYAIQKDGTTSSTASWDANALMDADDRKDKLWSVDSSGSLVKFANLDDAAFDLGGSLVSALTSALTASPTVATIKSYTIDPSYDSGNYLGDRDSSSMIGAPYITQPVVMGDIVVFQTDDGFVYAVDSTTGALKWGFIPRPLVAGLKNYEEFYTTHPMAGQIATLNSGSDETAGYIVGAADSGNLHYALQVDSDGDLSKYLWVDETTSNLAHSPILMHIGSTPYAVYITGSSDIKAQSLESSPSDKTYSVPNKVGNLTAAPMAHVEYELDTSGKVRVQEGDIYIGDDEGNVYYGELVSSSSLVNNLQLTLVGNIGTSSDVSDDVLYLEHATETSAEYVTAQSLYRLKTFRIPSDETSYLETWTSYNSGSGYWNESGSSYTEETTFSPNTEHIQKLPTSATITDKATIAASVVFLPVLIETDEECSAYYYLYQLTDGFFPSNTIYSADIVDDNVKVGEGNAFQANVMVHNGDVVVQGGSETNKNQVLGVDDSFTFTVSPGGRSGWREVTGE